MVSQDVEGSLWRRTFKWAAVFFVSLIFIIIIQFFSKKILLSISITVFVIFLIIAVVSFLLAFFNFIILLKVKKAIQTYHNGNYETAKDLAIKAYKISNYKEINDLIEYIDSQIIDELVTQQERLELQETTEGSEYLYDIDDQIKDIKFRINRLKKIKKDIETKLADLKKQDDQETSEKIKKQIRTLIDQYSYLLKFTEFKINAYSQILSKVQDIRQKHKNLDKILKEHEDFKDLQEKLLTEGFTALDEEEEQVLEFIKREKTYIEYIKEFLASTQTLENFEEFSKIYKDLNDRLEDLDINTTLSTNNNSKK